MFPASMLASLLVKGSLKNTESGFELKLRNNIDSGTITGLGSVSVDDRVITADKITLQVGKKEVKGDQVTPRQPLPVGVMSEIRIMVEDAPLAAGPHKLGFQISSAEAGKLNFSVTENLSE